MTYTFADRLGNLAPSAIREILKFTSLPGVISFAAGNPAPEAFPTEDVKRISNELLETDPIAVLQYSITEGYAPLVSAVKDYLAMQSMGNDGDSLIITSGAQQVMDLATKALCNPGDTILCEAPSFIGSLNAFRSYGTNIVGVPVENDGMNLELLEDALKREKNVRFIYTIPNFQNPCGITMSFEKRKALYALAKKYGVLIIEDNPYGELRFKGENIPSVKSLDKDGLVIYVGSFSKVLSPGMRVGYTLAPSPIISKLTVCKQVSDVHTNIWAQTVAYKFMTECDFAGHLDKIRDIYRRKSTIMLSRLEEVAGKIEFTRPEGGLFIWCTLPDGIDMSKFCTELVQEKLAVVPGNAFMVDENAECNSFRINFSTPSDEQLSKGMDILNDKILRTVK